MEESEIWKDINGYEGLYQVSSLGRVKSLSYNRSKNERVLKTRLHNNGYTQFVLYKDQKGISFKGHRLVAELFIPNPENKPQVNHKNGIKDDNRVENLEWVTNDENNKHSWQNLHRRVVKGVDHYRSKLSYEQVLFIRNNKHISSTKIANMFHVNKSTILRVRNKKSWKSI